MKRLVNVEIYGNAFNLRTDVDQDYVNKLSDYVTAKMKEIEVRLPFKSTEKVALLAAFFIADEFFTYKREQEKKLAGIEDRMKSMLDK